MVGIPPSRSHLLTPAHSLFPHPPSSLLPWCSCSYCPAPKNLLPFYPYLSRLYLFTEACLKETIFFKCSLVSPVTSYQALFLHPLSAGTLSMWGFGGKYLVTCPSVLPDYELQEAKVSFVPEIPASGVGPDLQQGQRTEPESTLVLLHAW